MADTLKEEYAHLRRAAEEFLAEDEPTPDERRLRILKLLVKLVGNGTLVPDGPHGLDNDGRGFLFKFGKFSVVVSHFAARSRMGVATEGEYMLEIDDGFSNRTCTAVSNLPAEQSILVRQLWGEIWTGSQRMLKNVLYHLEALDEEAEFQQEGTVAPVDKASGTEGLPKTL